jgi:hypothetical protein
MKIKVLLMHAAGCCYSYPSGPLHLTILAVLHLKAGQQLNQVRGIQQSKLHHKL